MISVVVPAYNEEESIGKLVEKVSKKLSDANFELIVIDDGSIDSTLEKLKSLSTKVKELKIVNLKKNRGFGFALKTGIKKAKGDTIVTMDSDLTHPPELIPKLVREIKNGADVVIASRYVKGGGMENVPFRRVLLSRAANLAFSIAFFTRARDLTGGFKAYRASLIKGISFERNNFSVQIEIMVKCIKRKAKIVEIPLVLKNRELGESKFNFFKEMPQYITTVFFLFFKRWF